MQPSFITSFNLVVILFVDLALSNNDMQFIGTGDQEVVLTPAGPRPKSSVFLVPDGARICHKDNEVLVLWDNGTIIHRSPQITSGSKSAPPEPTLPRPEPSFAKGWVAFAHYTIPSSTPVKSFWTTWTVPPIPTTNHGQTVFLFNGLEPEERDYILQPVLQWGPSAAGGGPYWQVSSWYVGPSKAVTFYSPLVSVAVGQSLTGVMTIDADENIYKSYFVGIPKTTLIISKESQLVWATMTLEGYGIHAKSDYPMGSTLFKNTNLVGPSSVMWKTSSTPADGLSATIVRNGGVNAAVNIRYT